MINSNGKMVRKENGLRRSNSTKYKHENVYIVTEFCLEGMTLGRS